jgi:hypothetical protein
VALYRKKPVEVEAWVIEDLMWAFTNGTLPQVIQEAHAEGKISFADGCIYIETEEGCMRGPHDSYLIKGIIGEFYACLPDVFKATYEEVDPNEVVAL